MSKVKKVESSVISLSKSYSSGWDSFSPDPGKTDHMQCNVCLAEMDVQRNVIGPTSWAGAMARSNRRHDRFTCPHTGKGWHNQALEIRKSAKDTPSKIVFEALTQEADDICRLKKPTLERFNHGARW
jgi:hypothetical protein